MNPLSQHSPSADPNVRISTRHPQGWLLPAHKPAHLKCRSFEGEVRLHDARGLHSSPQHVLLRRDVVALGDAGPGRSGSCKGGMGVGASVGANWPLPFRPFISGIAPDSSCLFLIER